MWLCPKCKSKNLDVEISTWARLSQYVEDGEHQFSTVTDEAMNNDHEWDETNSMSCRDCGHVATAKTFEIEDDPDEDQYEAADDRVTAEIEGS